MSKLTTLVASSIGLRILNAILLLGASIALAKWLGPEKLGIYTLVFSIASIVGIPITAGLPTLLTRETAILYRAGCLTAWKGLLKFGFFLVVAVSIIGVGILAGYYLLFGVFSIPYFSYLALVIVLVPVIGLDRLRGSVMQGLGSSLLAQIPGELVRPLAYLVALWLGLSFYSGDALDYALGAYVLTAVLAFLCGSYLLNRMLKGSLHDVGDAEYRIKSWIFSLFSLGALSASQTMVGNSDILILGWLGTVRDVGIYKVALQGVALMLIVQNGIGAVLTVSFAQSFADNDIERIIRVSDSSVALFSLTALFALVTFLLFGDVFILVFFGEQYITAVSVLIVLTIGQLFNTCTGPTMTLLVMSKNDRSALAGVLIGGTATILIAFFSVPSFLTLGMAASAACGVAINNMIMARAVKNRLGFDPTIIGAYRRYFKKHG